MYKLRRQPWKLLPLRPPEVCCSDDRPPEAEARSGIPGEEVNRENENIINVVYLIYTLVQDISNHNNLYYCD